MNERPPQFPDVESEPADLFDYARIADHLRYGVGCVRRHKLLAVAVVAAVMGIAVGALAVLPKTYHVETRLLAQRNQVMASLGNPGRSVPGEFDAPTRAASETILNHDNLVSLVKQTNLIERWDATRAPAQRFKDWILSFRGPPTAEERTDALIGLLEKRITVETGEGTVTIGVTWNDPQLAYRLVEAAQQNFLEARHVSEISTIAESITILQGHANAVREMIDNDVDELQRARDAKAGKARPPPARPAARAADRDLLQLRLLLAAKRRDIADVEEFRRKRLSELQTELARQKATYSDQHPMVMDTQQTIDALQQDSPQLANLRKEEFELSNEYLRRGGKLADLDRDGSEPAMPQLETETQRTIAAPAPAQDDPSLSYLRNRLQFSLGKYNGLLDRIDSARIELDSARAAFKYRYSVIKPPQVPKVPEKPKPAVILSAAAAAGVLLAILIAISVDVASGVVYQRWQVERSLGLPVLSALRRP